MNSRQKIDAVIASLSVVMLLASAVTLDFFIIMLCMVICLPIFIATTGDYCSTELKIEFAEWDEPPTPPTSLEHLRKETSVKKIESTDLSPRYEHIRLKLWRMRNAARNDH